jgi:hypothetical protein
MINIKNQLKQALSKPYIQTAFFFVLIFSILSLVYFSLDRFTSHDDSFFHIRFAEILRTQGFGAFANFPWIQFSKIAQNQEYYIYYNFFFYLFIIPFTYIQPLFLGLKLYAIVFATLAFTGFYYILKKLGQSWPLLWTFTLFTLISGGLIQRSLLARPFVLAPTLLLLLLLSLHRKNYWLAAITTIVYFYWHSATFFFPLGVTCVYLVFESIYKRKPSWKLLAYVGGATLLSVGATILFTPGFVAYMRDIIFELLWQVGSKQEVQIIEGAELYGADFFDFLRGNSLMISLFIMATVLEIYGYFTRRKNGVAATSELDILRSTCFFLSLGLFWATFLSFRNADFFVWIAYLFICLSLNDLFKSINIASRTNLRSVQISFVIILVYLSSSQLLTLHTYIASREPYYSIQGSAEWLKNNTKAGENVFISNWGLFTRLFYYNTQNYYTMGIEPRFLYDMKPELYWQWVHMTRDGYACNKQECPDLQAKREQAVKYPSLRTSWNLNEGNEIALIIKRDFRSQLIVVYQNQAKFKGILDSNSNFTKAYDDTITGGFSVYTIK